MIACSVKAIWTELMSLSPQVTIVRQRDKLQSWFEHFLVEDKSLNGGSSYVDFLCHIHKEIRSILSWAACWHRIVHLLIGFTNQSIMIFSFQLENSINVDSLHVIYYCNYSLSCVPALYPNVITCSGEQIRACNVQVQFVGSGDYDVDYIRKLISAVLQKQSALAICILIQF